MTYVLVGVVATSSKHLIVKTPKSCAGHDFDTCCNMFVRLQTRGYNLKTLKLSIMYYLLALLLVQKTYSQIRICNFCVTDHLHQN